MFMKAFVRAITAVGALAVPLPVDALLILIGGVTVLALFVCMGIALPAVWSAKPARRKAAAAVLGQVLNACTGGEHR
jgi:hypothetical protein